MIVNRSESLLTGVGTERRAACLATVSGTRQGPPKGISEMMLARLWDAGTLGTLWARNGNAAPTHCATGVPHPRLAARRPGRPVARHDDGLVFREHCCQAGTDVKH